MKVLVVGGGGREHALAWKISRSPLVSRVFCAPGKGGIAKVAECVPIDVLDLDGLVDFATRESVDLVVVGPEAPLCAGLADRLEAAEIKVFGPSQSAAEIEGSKAFCRELCKKHHIPSPASWTFSDLAAALAFLETHRDEPLVVKASGLAAGKGVMICEDYASARAAVAGCLESGSFGTAGEQIVIEEFLEGEEVSMLALCDGRTIVPLESAKDHKRSLEGDKGPNTGGMGAISPAPAANPRTVKHVESQVLVQTIHAMVQERRPYRGILYAGLMVTSLGPRVLEFNARFGDPEAQPLLMRLESDLVPFLVAAADGKLDTLESGPAWDPRPAACVVAVSGGYPGEYTTGHVIRGLDEVEESDELVVFHSGTKLRPDGSVVTAGGRVLSVTAKAKTLRLALDRCYAALDKISFSGMRIRTDIGKR